MRMSFSSMALNAKSIRPRVEDREDGRPGCNAIVDFFGSYKASGSSVYGTEAMRDVVSATLKHLCRDCRYRMRFLTNNLEPGPTQIIGCSKHGFTERTNDKR